MSGGVKDLSFAVGFLNLRQKVLSKV